MHITSLTAFQAEIERGERMLESHVTREMGARLLLDLFSGVAVIEADGEHWLANLGNDGAFLRLFRYATRRDASEANLHIQGWRGILSKVAKQRDGDRFFGGPLEPRIARSKIFHSPFVGGQVNNCGVRDC